MLVIKISENGIIFRLLYKKCTQFSISFEKTAILCKFFGATRLRIDYRFIDIECITLIR
ncbi:hypothetical protein BpHYR1_027058 [Brachionus plicatilis]|uniref:Uncharacterized protein n=1 Tax=Brachionus plicatilis TaxID=10195 RepID=A0A3M7PU44_BRAPC|nr:hypothetical protein BpHYR1_027058 [Brachionus plicatilis]